MRFDIILRKVRNNSAEKKYSSSKYPFKQIQYLDNYFVFYFTLPLDIFQEMSKKLPKGKRVLNIVALA